MKSHSQATLRESDTLKVNLLHNAGHEFGGFVIMLLLHFQVLDMQIYNIFWI